MKLSDMVQMVEAKDTANRKHRYGMDTSVSTATALDLHHRGEYDTLKFLRFVQRKRNSK